MKRLLFITERFPPDIGGVAASAGRIATTLAELGLEVDVLAWTRSLPSGQVTHHPGNPQVFRLGRFREWDATMPHTANLCDWLFSLNPYDAIWGHYLAPAGFFAVSLAKLKQVKCTVSIRGNDLDRDLFPPGDFAPLLWTLQNATVITTVTKELARKVVAICGRCDSIALPNAVNADLFKPVSPEPSLRQKLGIGRDEVVLGFAGELREKKGQQFLLEALRRVRELRPACLLIIGEVRPSQMPQLLQTIGTSRPEEQGVLITGHLTEPSQVNEHLQLCDVFLQPSLWDGMPNALLEAMAAACACIASDAGGIPELITSGVDGFIVPRWELQRLHTFILDFLDADHAQRSRIKQSARRTIVENFGVEQERRNLQVVLDRLMPNSP